jgi:hypothetical protein
LKNVKNQDAHFKGSEMETPTLRSQKLFSKTSQSAPSHASNLPPCRNVGLQAMPFMGFGVADHSQRSTQHKRNAELSCLVASGRDRKKFYATPESLKHMVVAALRVYWRG